MDDFDFFEDPIEPTPATEATLDPTPTPQPSIDPQQFAALQQQQHQTAQFMDALKQSLGVSQPQNQQNQFLEQFLNQPQQSLAPLIQQTVQAQMEGYRLDQEYSQKYPELVPFKELVAKDAIAIQSQSYQAGRPLSERDALEQAATQWNQKLDAMVQARQQQANAGALRANALPFSVPSQGQSPPTAGTRDFSKMSNEDFVKFSKSLGLNV
jgi:hypothetical protein